MQKQETSKREPAAPVMTKEAAFAFTEAFVALNGGDYMLTVIFVVGEWVMGTDLTEAECVAAADDVGAIVTSKKCPELVLGFLTTAAMYPDRFRALLAATAKLAKEGAPATKQEGK